MDGRTCAVGDVRSAIDTRVSSSEPSRRAKSIRAIAAERPMMIIIARCAIEIDKRFPNARSNRNDVA